LVTFPLNNPTRTKSSNSFARKAERVSRCPGDIRDEGFCNRLVAETVSELGGLDILVNNAARQISHKDLKEISTQDFDGENEVKPSQRVFDRRSQNSSKNGPALPAAWSHAPTTGNNPIGDPGGWLDERRDDRGTWRQMR
jgi:Enoyl-(Acyl carrier protein) reductase